MTYLLDTNAYIQYLTHRSSLVVTKMSRMPRQEIFLCDVVKAELYYGAYKSSRRKTNLALYEEFFSEFTSLPFDDRAAKIYGQIRTKLESRGIPIGPYDFQIAAIALANHFTLITHNTREFERVENLQLEDWSLAE